MDPLADGDGEITNGHIEETLAAVPRTPIARDERVVALIAEVQKHLATITYWYWRRRDLALNPGADALRTAALGAYRLVLELNARAEHIDPTSRHRTT